MGNSLGDGLAARYRRIESACGEADSGMADAALVPFGQLIKNDSASFLDGDAARDEIIGK